MTISLGRIESVQTHFGEMSIDDPTLRPICIQGGGKFTPRALNIFTNDAAKVTCQGCLEWLHA